MEQKPLFKGHVFLESGNPEQLLEELKGLRTLGARLSLVLPEEERFLRLLCGEDHHLGFSRGYIREGRTCVIEGPLQGREAWIGKIDRHKRLARVRVPGMKAPGIKTTGMRSPKTEIPGTKVSGVEILGTEVSGVEVPGMEVSGVEIPGMKDMDWEVRELHKEICAGLEIVSKD